MLSKKLYLTAWLITTCDAYVSYSPLLRLRFELKYETRFHQNKIVQKKIKKNRLKLNEVKSSERELDLSLSENNLREVISILKSNPTTELNKSRFISIFRSIEQKTKKEEEVIEDEKMKGKGLNDFDNVEYAKITQVRMEMTEMYSLLKSTGNLKLFGGVEANLPAAGSKTVTPTLLEEVSGLSMSSLTPKQNNSFLIFGVLFGVIQGLISFYTGIDLSLLFQVTLGLAIIDNLLLNGGGFESFSRLVMPSLSDKITRHEAGHFLVAYLLGCPVEGCVLNAWAALQDARFRLRRTTLSAGTSFFDPDLSEQINGIKPLLRSSIDRFSIIVMAGISAEAIHFGQADGGASDETSLITFLSQIQPSSPGTTNWTSEAIRNQARWAALQSVLILKYYEKSYDALVDALKRGGDLGECIYAIENAARDYHLQPLNAPIGTIVDKGLYGIWEEQDMSKDEVKNTNDKQDSLKNVDYLESTSSVEQRLKQFRKTLEDKVNEIDDKLQSY